MPSKPPPSLAASKLWRVSSGSLDLNQWNGLLNFVRRPALDCFWVPDICNTPRGQASFGIVTTRAWSFTTRAHRLQETTCHRVALPHHEIGCTNARSSWRGRGYTRAWRRRRVLKPRSLVLPQPPRRRKTQSQDSLPPRSLVSAMRRRALPITSTWIGTGRRNPLIQVNIFGFPDPKMAPRLSRKSERFK
jgi:hypothetical protein